MHKAAVIHNTHTVQHHNTKREKQKYTTEPNLLSRHIKVKTNRAPRFRSGVKDMLEHQDTVVFGDSGTQDMNGSDSVKQLSLFKHLKKKNANDAQLLMYECEISYSMITLSIIIII